MTDDSLLAGLAEEFVAGIRSGKAPNPEEYAVRYPQLANCIRELFPTLMNWRAQLEQKKPPLLGKRDYPPDQSSVLIGSSGNLIPDSTLPC